MANTTTELLTVDGVVLNTYAKNIESLAGRLNTPPLRTPNIQVPGRHGSVRPSQRLYADNTISLPMWVRGCDDDGLVSTTKRRHFYSNLDALTQLFGYHKSQLNLRHVLPDGSTREAFCETLDVIQPQIDSAANEIIGRFTVILTMNDPFWQDIADVTQQISGTPGGVTSLSNFAGATAPMDDLVIRFTGPINNPTITSVYDSSVLAAMYSTYQANLGSGQWIEFNTRTFDWTVGGGAAAFNFANWAHSGSGRLFTLFPGKSAGAPQIHWAGGGAPTGTTKLNVTGRRKYMVG